MRCVLRADGLVETLVPTVAPPQGEGQLPLDLPHAVHQRGQRGARRGGWRGSHCSISLRDEDGDRDSQQVSR